MHDAGHESVRKLDHQAIIPNIHDRGAKDLRIALLELLLEKLKLLSANRFDFGLGRVSFGIGNVVGQGFDLADVDLGSSRQIALSQRAMDHEIGVASDWTGEMEVMGFGQTIMSEGLCRVSRPLQTFEQTDLECLLFRLALDRRQKSLDFFAVREIADFVTKAENEFAIFSEFFRIGIFMHAVNCRNGAMP